MFGVDELHPGIVGTSAAQYTLDNYAMLLLDPAFVPALLNTLLFAASATVVALLIGLPVAWLVERSRMPAKALVYAVVTTGVLIPGIYIAMGWTFVVHPRIGFINTWLQGAFGEGAPVVDLTSPIGMGLIQGLSYVPLAFILSVQTFRAMNPALEETACIHGLGAWRTARRITLPLARPGILAALIYILTIAIATFDIPAVLSMGNRVYVLSTYLYLKSQPLGASGPQYGVTAALGAFMILVALGLSLWYAQVLRQSHRFQVISGKVYRPTPFKLGRVAAGAAWSSILLYVVLAVVVPLVIIAFSVWLIVVVYVIGRFAFATRSFNTALLQVHRELEEAALVSGLSTLRTAWRILLPILCRRC